MKKILYHVAYAWSTKAQNGFGNTILSMDRTSITLKILDKWRECISEQLVDNAKIVIINWIRIKD